MGLRFSAESEQSSYMIGAKRWRDVMQTPSRDPWASARTREKWLSAKHKIPVVAIGTEKGETMVYCCFVLRGEIARLPPRG